MKQRFRYMGKTYEWDDVNDGLLPYDRSLKIYEETAADHGITPGVRTMLLGLPDIWWEDNDGWRHEYYFHLRLTNLVPPPTMGLLSKEIFG